MGAAIPGTTIVFRARKIEKKVVVGERGTYETGLPAGAYRVEVRNSTYRPFGCKIRVRSTETLTLRIVLVLKGKHTLIID